MTDIEFNEYKNLVGAIVLTVFPVILMALICVFAYTAIKNERK